jgi:glycosyltransferase involved in cell wall biosynthesis
LNIHYHSFLPHLGYGVASKGYVQLLRNEAIYKINWKGYNFNDNDIQTYLKEFEEEDDVKEKINFIHLTPEYISKTIETKSLNILNTVYETTRFPEEWKDFTKSVDKIAVPCTWNQEIFKNALNRKIYLLPHLSQFNGIPVDYTKTMELFNVNKSTFMFLTVATWERRKNLEQLVHSFCKAFSSKDDVVLFVKTSKNNIASRRTKWNLNKYLETTDITIKRLLRFKVNHPRIILINDVLSEYEMQALYSRADAYVTLTHGEGWGFGCYESAWYGKPIIATGFGGYLDYLKTDNSYLVPYKLTKYKPNYWDTYDRSSHQYAQPELNTAIDMMRDVFKNRDTAYHKASKLKINVQKNFNGASIKNYLLDFIHH